MIAFRYVSRADTSLSPGRGCIKVCCEMVDCASQTHFYYKQYIETLTPSTPMASLEHLYRTLPVTLSWNPSQEEARIAAYPQPATRIQFQEQGCTFCTIDPRPRGTQHYNIPASSSPVTNFSSPITGLGAKVITWNLLQNGYVAASVFPGSTPLRQTNWNQTPVVQIGSQFQRDFGLDPRSSQNAYIQLEMLTVDSSYAPTQNLYFVSATISIRFRGKHIQYMVLAKYGANYVHFLHHVLRE